MSDKYTHYLWAAFIGVVVGIAVGTLVFIANKGADGIEAETQAQNWASEKLLKLSMESDKGLFFVVSYKSDGTIDKQILCSHVRKDDDLKELICEEYGTGDFYLLYFPATITNVTLARDYIKFTNSK